MASEPVLPYGRQCIEEDDIAAVVDVLRGDWLTQGPAIAEFEQSICAATGAKYAVAVANGTAALHLACIAAGCGPQAHGLTSTVTFVASANAIRYAGARPHLVDVEPDTGLMSLESLRSTVTSLVGAGTAPKVIIPVDLAGNVADLPAIRAIADECGAVIIEDAAHSLGAVYRHEDIDYRAASCAHSDMAILSFHPVKHVTTGEGGAVTTNDERIYRTLTELRTHGITKETARLTRSDGPWYYEQQALGYNYRISDIHAALGVSQLKKLGRFLTRRREIARTYDVAFAQPSLRAKVRPLQTRVGVNSAYHLYVLSLVRAPDETLESVAERRRAFFVALQAARIAPQVHYIPVHTQPDFCRSGFSDGEFPGASEYYAGCVSLPMFPAMTDADVTRVISAVEHLA